MSNSDETKRYQVTIVGFQSERHKDVAAAVLAKIFKNLPADKIRRRLDKLPWLLLKRSAENNTIKIVRLLKRCHAEVEVSPPLPSTTVDMSQDTVFQADSPAFSAPSASAPPFTYQTQVEEAPPAFDVQTEHGAGSLSPKPIEPGWDARRELPGERAFPESRPSEPKRDDGAPGYPAIHKERAPYIDHSDALFDLAPHSVTELLDKTMQLCIKNFGKFFAINIIYSLISVGVVLVFALGGVSLAIGSKMINPYLLNNIAGLASAVGLMVLFVISGVLAIMVGYALVQGAMIQACSSAVLDRPFTVKDCLLFALGRVKQLALTQILMGLSVIGIFLAGLVFGSVGVIIADMINRGLAIGVGVILTILTLLLVVKLVLKLMLVDKVVILEDKYYIDALKRSWELMSGKASDSFPKSYENRLGLLLLLYWGIALVASLVFSVPGKLVEYLTQGTALSSLGFVVNTMGQVLSGAISGIFLSVALVLFYYDIRARKEGFDLQMLSEARNETSRN